MRRIAFAILVLVLALASSAADPAPDESKIEVQVLAIMVSEHHKNVHPKLAQFALHVQKKDANLTGFRLHRTHGESLELGDTKKFDLIGQEKVEVTVNKERNDKGRITLTIKPPGLEQITYECACDKFFTVATQHHVGKGKSREQLFVAIMAKPCGLQKK